MPSERNTDTRESDQCRWTKLREKRGSEDGDVGERGLNCVGWLMVDGTLDNKGADSCG